MIICAALALVGLYRDKVDCFGLVAFIPQQFIVLVGTIASIVATVGVFDEFSFSRGMRVVPMHLWLAVFHTCAILEFFSARLWTRSR